MVSPHRFLKEMAEPLTPANLIFQASLNQGKVTDDWERQMFLQYLRKSTRAN